MDNLDKIIAEVFQIPESDIHGEMTPEDIESWDSLSQLLLINSIEEEYNITLEIEEIFQIMKIQDMYDILSKKGLI